MESPKISKSPQKPANMIILAHIQLKDCTTINFAKFLQDEMALTVDRLTNRLILTKSLEISNNLQKSPNLTILVHIQVMDHSTINSAKFH